MISEEQLQFMAAHARDPNVRVLAAEVRRLREVAEARDTLDLLAKYQDELLLNDELERLRRMTKARYDSLLVYDDNLTENQKRVIREGLAELNEDVSK